MPAPPIAPGDELIMTIAPRRRAGLLAGVYGGVTAVLALVATLWGLGRPWALAISVPFVLLFGAIAVRHARELTHHTVLTSSQLIAPAPLRGWAVIDLADVVAVAMHYEGDHEAGVEWELRIGTAGGRAVAFPVDEHPHLLGWASPPPSDGEAERERRRLSERTGGGPAAVIAAQVIAVQGLEGPFERAASSG
jgi:hypothetical protein